MRYVIFRTASGRAVRLDFETRAEQARWILRAPAAYTIVYHN